MYHILRQKRKTVSIDIDDQLDIIVKVPQWLKTAEIHELIEKHSSWIEKRIKQKVQHKAQNDWQVTGKILYLGEYRTINKMPGSYKRSNTILHGNQLIVKTQGTGHLEEVTKLVEHFFKEQAKNLLKKLTDYYADLLEVSYHKITIRKQKTRWGSCSSKGNISYNVKILCAPEQMIAYIALHEVMHLKHFNHGKAFWQELAEVMPDYKERMNYFKQFGQNFMI